MNSLSDKSQYFERRTNPDRRQREMRIFSKYLFTGRRTEPRREEDKQRFHWIDRYSAKTLSVVLLIVLLSVLDALLTLDLIFNRGAVELNPVMAYCLEYGALTFFWVKYLLTCLGVLIVLLTKNVFIFKTGFQAKFLFLLFLLPFLLVVHWELFLLFIL